ncbi:MAG: hypothetical protein K0S71_2557 [Clostridia bacterium]|jgi:hypothetical protein|nr:hypothetical protein [Clostridia bacterium]
MSSHSILIYGAGNCEIAGALDFELNQITQISRPNIKIFARGYLFNNSCIAMYRRFKDLKTKIREIGQGGVHEYFYNGEETIKTCELKMQAATEETFEDFLKTGIQKIKDSEIILILIGQGNLQGMFLDFSQNPPTYMPYETIFSIIEKCSKEKVKKLSLIIDVSNWHGIYMPLCIAEYSFIDAVFVYDRESYLNIFPIYRWTEQTFRGQSHWLEETYLSHQGCKIDTHPVWWRLCKNKWDEYAAFPSAKSWIEFNSIYKKLVIYKGVSKRAYNQVLRNKQADGCNQLAIKDIQEYFNAEYLSNVYEDEVEKWLSELKICTDYYK